MQSIISMTITNSINLSTSIERYESVLRHLACLYDLTVEAKDLFTGLWGCGAFRGDVELKFIIQWIGCSLEPSVRKMIFCPWDKRQYLLDRGLAELEEQLQGKVSVKKVLDLLVQDTDYETSRSTFTYLMHKLSSDM